MLMELSIVDGKHASSKCNEWPNKNQWRNKTGKDHFQGLCNQFAFYLRCECNIVEFVKIVQWQPIDKCRVKIFLSLSTNQV